MALSTPILGKIQSFDQSNGNFISYTFSGGDTPIGYVLTIKENGVIVYQGDDTDLNYALIPPNVGLINSNKNTSSMHLYSAQIQTKDASGSLSNLSNAVTFYCFEAPVVSLTGVSDPLTTPSLNVSYSYSQSGGEVFVGGEFKLYLGVYNSLPGAINTLVAQSGYIYASGTTSPNSVAHTFNNLSNKTQYTVRFTGDSEFSFAPTISQKFTTNYITPGDSLTLTVSNNCSEGNITVTTDTSPYTSSINAVRIKRRILGALPWITLYTFIVDIKKIYTYTDNLNQHGVTYEYAAVPVVGGTLVNRDYQGGTEGNYTIIQIESKFDGVFLTDSFESYKFYSEVSYGNLTRNHKTGKFEPFGSKYPIIVSNSIIDYDSATLSFLVTPPNSDFSTGIPRVDIEKQRVLLLKFCTNNGAKILKDWNGNFWMVAVGENPSVSFKPDVGMGLNNLLFSWDEIGDAYSQSDLFTNGLVRDSIE